MSQDNYSEKELQQLESELRSMGEPYSQGAPGPEYFADFSRRVMNRVNAEHNIPATVSFVSRMKTTFFGSTLRTSIVGGVVIGALVAVLVMNQGTDTPIAISDPMPQVVLPQTTAPQAPQVQIAEEPVKKESVLPQKHLPKHNASESVPHNIVNENNNSMPMPNGTPVDAIDQAADFSGYDETLSTGNDDDPVTFDKLHTSELEAILKILDEKQ